MSLEQYQTLKVIGKGSYGEVWLAKHKKDRKQYVLKKLNICNVSKRERKAAELEAKLLSKMKHPNIVAYKDSFEEGGFLYIAMGFCDGGDLYSKLKEQKGMPLEERQVIEWFIQMAMALQYMHDQNILHRDLKTQNIFLTKSKIIKVGDLGIARVLESSCDMATTLIGTPYYMSPELFSNRPYNMKSDVWALGCCVYEMTTLKHAFNAKDMNSLVYKILQGKMPPMPKEYSAELVALIKSMLNHNPDKRPTVQRILRDPYIRKYIAEFLANTKKQSRPSSSSSSKSVKSHDVLCRRSSNDDDTNVIRPLPQPVVDKYKPLIAVAIASDSSGLEPLNLGPDLEPIAEESTEKYNIVGQGTAESGSRQATLKGEQEGARVAQGPTIVELDEDDGTLKTVNSSSEDPKQNSDGGRSAPNRREQRRSKNSGLLGNLKQRAAANQKFSDFNAPSVSLSPCRGNDAQSVSPRKGSGDGRRDKDSVFQGGSIPEKRVPSEANPAALGNGDAVDSPPLSSRAKPSVEIKLDPRYQRAQYVKFEAGAEIIEDRPSKKEAFQRSKQIASPSSSSNESSSSSGVHQSSSSHQIGGIIASASGPAPNERRQPMRGNEQQIPQKTKVKRSASESSKQLEASEEKSGVEAAASHKPHSFSNPVMVEQRPSLPSFPAQRDGTAVAPPYQSSVAPEKSRALVAPKKNQAVESGYVTSASNNSVASSRDALGESQDSLLDSNPSSYNSKARQRRRQRTADTPRTSRSDVSSSFKLQEAFENPISSNMGREKNASPSPLPGTQYNPQWDRSAISSSVDDNYMERPKALDPPLRSSSSDKSLASRNDKTKRNVARTKEKLGGGESSSEEDDESTVVGEANVHGRKEKNGEKEMSKFINLLDTTLHMGSSHSRSNNNAKIKSKSDDDDDDDDPSNIVIRGSATYIKTSSDIVSSVDSNMVIPLIETEYNQTIQRRAMNVPSPGERTLTTNITGRLWERIAILRKDCLKHLGVVKMKKAYDIMDNFEAEELEPQLITLLGEADYDEYAGKIWQLKFCEEAAFGLV